MLIKSPTLSVVLLLGGCTNLPTAASLGEFVLPDRCAVREIDRVLDSLNLEEMPPERVSVAVWCDFGREQGPYAVPLDGDETIETTLVYAPPTGGNFDVGPVSPDWVVDLEPVYYECDSGHEVLLGHWLVADCENLALGGSRSHYLRVEWHYRMPRL